MNKNTITITRLLLISITAMYIVEVYFNYKYGGKSLILLGAKWNPGIITGEYWRFFTYAFLHGNLVHLLLNSVFLHTFGTEAEMYLGKYKFSILYLISIWGAGLASYALSTAISIAASGGVFGIIGFLCVFYFKLGKHISAANERYKTMYTLVIVNIIISFFIPNIDNGAHMGGLISGLIAGIFFVPNYEVVTTDEKTQLKAAKKSKNAAITTFMLFSLFTLITILIT